MIQGLRTKNYARLADAERLLAKSSSYGELFCGLKEVAEVVRDAPGTQDGPAGILIQGVRRQS